MTGASPLRIVAIDDEPLALDRIAALLDRMEGAQLVGRTSNPREAEELARQQKPDLVLLDIQMPARSGLDLARSLIGGAAEVIFVTAHDGFAAEAFDLDAADYLVKPIDEDRLARALARARRRKQAAQPVLPARKVDSKRGYPPALWAPHQGAMVRVETASIDWVEAAKDYVLLHTPRRSHLLRATMERLKAQLDPLLHLRVSRSAYVRIGAVAKVKRLNRNGLALVLTDGTQVVVGPTYLEVVSAALGLGTRRAKSVEH